MGLDMGARCLPTAWAMRGMQQTTAGRHGVGAQPVRHAHAAPTSQPPHPTPTCNPDPNPLSPLAAACGP